MEVIRECVKTSQAVLEKSISCNVESNVIVPDKNPDILKILQVDATAAVTKRILKEGRLTVEGKVYADVLYLPEGMDGSVKTLPAVFEFSDFFDDAMLRAGMHSFVSCDIENVELNLINSRKITLRVTVAISAEVVADNDMEYIASINAEDIAYKCNDASCYLIVADDDIEFLIKEKVEVPDIIKDIIKCDAVICDKEIRTAGTKVIVKGAVSACSLYCTDEGNIECTNGRFPFTEVFEVGEEIEDDMIDISTNIIEKSCNIGSQKSIRYEFLVRVELSARKNESFNYMSDCYFFNSETEIKSEEFHFECAKKLPNAVKSVREIIMCTEHMPRISSVYNVVAKPHIVSTEKFDKGLSVNARLDVSVLYLSDNKENPICCQKAEIPVFHTIDADNVSDVTLMAECEHISYALTSGGDVEIRASVIISGEERVVLKRQIMTEVEKHGTEGRNEIVIVFASGGESLWDFAKKYKVSSEYIAQLNELDEALPLDEGRKLVIPV